jgi:hypothetical protein
MTKLFYVRSDTSCETENVDLIVRADDEKKAVASWRRYYKDWDLPAKPQWVGEIPVEGRKGAIAWHLINPT